MSEIVKKEGSLVTLKLTIDQDNFEKACQEAFQKNKGKFNIHGFRKGKAPRKIIEMQYGEGVFFEDAIDAVFPVAFETAIKEHELDVVSRPALDIEEIGKGKDLKLVVDVYVKPEVTLGDYKTIEAVNPKADLPEDAVEKDLEKKREEGARIVGIEDRPVKMGDKVKLDFLGKVDGVAFDGGTGNNFDLEIGSGSFIPGFEEQLVGMSLAEEKDIDVTFPQEYHAEELKGKAAVFTVKINEITEKQLPDLDDEFAKDVSEFDTLKELKADISKKLTEEKEKSAQDVFRNNVVLAAANQSTVEIPDVMIDNQIEDMIRDLRHNLQYQGLDLETYLMYTGSDLNKLKTEMRPEAENRVKVGLVIEAISKKENVEATEKDIEKEYETMAQTYKMEVEKIKEFMVGREDTAMKDSIIFRKTVDLLLETAKEKAEEAEKTDESNFNRRL